MGHRRWSTEEMDRLLALYPSASPEELVAAFPGKKLGAIKRHACAIGIRRKHLRPVVEANGRHAIFKKLEEIRITKGMTRVELADIVGYHHSNLARWERGDDEPRWTSLLDWLDALNCDIYVTERKGVPVAEAPNPRRDCVKCLRPFKAEGRFNRICQKCSRAMGDAPEDADYLTTHQAAITVQKPGFGRTDNIMLGTIAKRRLGKRAPQKERP